jgi:hypothetical protein
VEGARDEMADFFKKSFRFESKKSMRGPLTIHLLMGRTLLIISPLYDGFAMRRFGSGVWSAL